MALGRRSYGIYLWHWPVIVFVGPPMGLELPRLPLVIVQVAVTLVLTELSYRFIETPARTTRRRPAIVVGAWSTAGLATAAIAAMVLIVPPERVLFQQTVIRPDIDFSRPEAVLAVQAGGATPSVSQGRPPIDAVPDPTESAPDPVPNPGPDPGPATRQLLLLGDSTALVLALNEPAGVPADWNVSRYARVGCAITTGQTIDAGASHATIHDPQCDDWYDDWAVSSTVIDPDLSVVMVGAWEVLDFQVDGQRLSFPSDAWTVHVTAAVERAIDAGRGEHGRVALLRLPCMAQIDGTPISTQARNDPARVDTFNHILEAAAAASPTVVTLALDDVLCPNGEPIGTIDGEVIRYDGVHLTPFGAAMVWSWLTEQIDALVPAR